MGRGISDGKEGQQAMVDLDEIPLHMNVQLTVSERLLLTQAKCVTCRTPLDLEAVLRHGRITCSNSCRQKRYRRTSAYRGR